MAKIALNLSKLPWKEILDMADLLLEKGIPEEEVIDQLSSLLDELIDFNAIVKNPMGAAIEAIDGLIFATAIKIAVSFSKKSPEDRKARKQERSNLEKAKIPKSLRDRISQIKK